MELIVQYIHTGSLYGCDGSVLNVEPFEVRINLVAS